MSAHRTNRYTKRPRNFCLTSGHFRIYILPGSLNMVGCLPKNILPATQNPLYPDKVCSFWTQNPLSLDRHMAIFRPQNPLFSGQTYGGASGGLTEPNQYGCFLRYEVVRGRASKRGMISALCTRGTLFEIDTCYARLSISVACLQ